MIFGHLSHLIRTPDLWMNLWNLPELSSFSPHSTSPHPRHYSQSTSSRYSQTAVIPSFKFLFSEVKSSATDIPSKVVHINNTSHFLMSASSLWPGYWNIHIDGPGRTWMVGKLRGFLEDWRETVGKSSGVWCEWGGGKVLWSAGQIWEPHIFNKWYFMTLGLWTVVVPVILPDWVCFMYSKCTALFNENLRRHQGLSLQLKYFDFHFFIYTFSVRSIMSKMKKWNFE